MYIKWCENPVVIAYAPRLLPVSTIPFPAITICPLIKSRVEAFNLSKVHDIVSKGAPLDNFRYDVFRKCFKYIFKKQLSTATEKDS